MNDKLSQEDINNLLNQDETQKKDALTPEELDTIGEIGNIFMGAASTTLSQLLGQKVDITTPKAEMYENFQQTAIEQEHIIFVTTYKKGLQGSVVFGLKKKDTAIIADLMMGGNGIIDKPEIGELQLSAVGEAMNQMVGTASTALSTMFDTQIEVFPPEIKVLQKGKNIELSEDLLTSSIVAIKFNLKIGALINSNIIQFMSINSAKSQIAEIQKIMKGSPESPKENVQSGSIVDSLTTETHSDPIKQSQPVHQPSPSPQPSYHQPPSPQPQPQSQVTVQPVQFSSFDKTANVAGETNKNLNLVMDVKLELTVELGRTDLPIKNVLELTRGSIIELDKVAGEPVELYANGKLIAKGEVVVIEDNFGLRITSIISPEQRIHDL